MARIWLSLIIVGLIVCTPQTAGAASQIRGVHLNIFGMGQRDVRAKNASQLDAAKGINAGLVRIALNWAVLESAGKGQYSQQYLAWLDATVDDLAVRGLRPLFNFIGAPCWASSDPKKVCATQTYDDWFPPSNPNDYADAFALLAARYGARVVAWEVWNEPNFTDPYWPGGAGQYVALLRAARTKTSFRPLIGGATSNADVAYLHQLYAAGALGLWDIYSVHVYTQTPDYCDVPLWSLKCGLPAIHDAMVAHGDSSPVWITEIGWSTFNVTPEQQAQYLTQSAGIIRTMPYVGAWAWYELYDNTYYPWRPPAKGGPAYYGLIDGKGKEKPAAAAFRGLP